MGSKQAHPEPGLSAGSGGGQTFLKTRTRALFFPRRNFRSIHGPGGQYPARIGYGIHPGQIRHLGFQLQTNLRIAGQKLDQIPAVAGQGLQHQGVGEFSRAYPIPAVGLGRKSLIQLRP